MATLTPTLTLTSTDASSDDLALSVTDSLEITSPSVGLSKISVDTTGANNIIQPNTDGQTYYVFVRHTGVDASGSTVTTTLNIEKTGDVIFGKLAAEEWAWFPCGGASHGIQLQSSSGTIVAEYAYWTKG
jgi:hypothetical protein